MNDLMSDLETTDTGQTSKILSIGLVYFDRETGEMGDSLYARFDPRTGINNTRTSSKATMAWWNTQRKSVREEAFSGTDNLDDFLSLVLPDFYKPKTKIWGNGATFDISILENAYAQLNREKFEIEVPWKFWDIRDVRTVVDLANGYAAKGGRPKGAHNPIVDCEWQINYVCRMINALRGD